MTKLSLNLDSSPELSQCRLIKPIEVDVFEDLTLLCPLIPDLVNVTKLASSYAAQRAKVLKGQIFSLCSFLVRGRSSFLWLAFCQLAPSHPWAFSNWLPPLVEVNQAM